MMTKEQVAERIEKKHKDIEKINKRIAKWSVDLSKEELDIAKEYGFMSYDNPLKNETRKKLMAISSAHERSKYFNEVDELARAYRELTEAEATLAKYEVQMTEIVNYENEDKIEVLVDFLNNWRAKAYEWYVKNSEKYIELKEKEDEEFEKYIKTSNLHFSNYREKMYAERRFLTDYYSDIASLTKELTQYKTLDVAKLNKILDDEVTNKYKDLVKRITAVVGEIKDVANLRIGEQRGEINGTVKGTLGTARVETISAGGYNIQVFHYRVLVHKVK